jgi:hypothetical protein
MERHKDIEFVRQTIGHRNLNATSGYVTHMDDEERQNRISFTNKMLESSLKFKIWSSKGGI